MILLSICLACSSSGYLKGGSSLTLLSLSGSTVFPSGCVFCTEPAVKYKMAIVESVHLMPSPSVCEDLIKTCVEWGSVEYVHCNFHQKKQNKTFTFHLIYIQ